MIGINFTIISATLQTEDYTLTNKIEELNTNERDFVKIQRLPVFTRESLLSRSKSR